MPKPEQCELLGLDLQELTEISKGCAQPAYRGRQLWQALYQQRAESIDSVSTLPLNFRRGLTDQGYSIGGASIQKRFISSDGTIRYLMRLADSETVETVWMPEGDGGESGDGTHAGEEEIA